MAPIESVALAAELSVLGIKTTVLGLPARGPQTLRMNDTYRRSNVVVDPANQSWSLDASDGTTLATGILPPTTDAADLARDCLLVLDAIQRASVGGYHQYADVIAALLRHDLPAEIVREPNGQHRIQVLLAGGAVLLCTNDEDGGLAYYRTEGPEWTAVIRSAGGWGSEGTNYHGEDDPEALAQAAADWVAWYLAQFNSTAEKQAERADELIRRARCELDHALTRQLYDLARATWPDAWWALISLDAWAEREGVGGRHVYAVLDKAGTVLDAYRDGGRPLPAAEEIANLVERLADAHESGAERWTSIDSHWHSEAADGLGWDTYRVHVVPLCQAAVAADTVQPLYHPA